MTENDIIKAHLKAQILIDEIEIRALRHWVLNRDFLLRATVLEKKIAIIELAIKELEK